MAKWSKGLEHEIYTLAALGTTQVEIATRLGIHRETIRRKWQENVAFRYESDAG